MKQIVWENADELVDSDVSEKYEYNQIFKNIKKINYKLMKKFSNIDEKKLVLTEQKPKINRLVDHLIKENIQVTYSGDVDEALTKKLTVEGSDKLVEKLNTIIENYKTATELSVRENLKYKYGSQLDQKSINQEIKESVSNIYVNVTPFPQDIFSAEDYELNEDTITLRSLKNMPTDYMDYINYNVASKYFENGNNVKMRYSNGSWELYFENNGKYGTTIDSKEDKYKKFIGENKEFVADFLRATSELVGTKNILLEKKLINIL